MVMHCFTRIGLMTFCAVVLPMSTAGAQDPVTNPLYIYRDRPSASKFEAMFEPFFFMPAEQSDRISVQEDFPAERAEAGKGTVLEYIVVFDGPDEWAQAAFRKKGIKLGSEPGVDLATSLGANPGDRVFLKFRARRPVSERK